MPRLTSMRVTEPDPNPQTIWKVGPFELLLQAQSENYRLCIVGPDGHVRALSGPEVDDLRNALSPWALERAFDRARNRR